VGKKGFVGRISHEKAEALYEPFLKSLKDADEKQAAWFFKRFNYHSLRPCERRPRSSSSLVEIPAGTGFVAFLLVH